MQNQNIITAIATRKGVREYNADSAAVHVVPDTQVTAAAIVDGIGSTPDIAHFSAIAAEVAARVGARKTPTLGILAAAELVAAPAAAEITPDGVAVLAVAEPGWPTAIAWTGDSRAYGWDGDRLWQFTTDHTVGQYLRQNGGGGRLDLLAGAHDNWIRCSLGRSSIATVHAAEIPAGQLVLLTSDGVHDALLHSELEQLVARLQHDPQTLTDAIVSIVQPDTDGYRDDATAVVLKTSK